MGKLLLFLLSFLSVMEVLGQYYDNGQAPFTVRWNQINTPNFQVIFPESLDSMAQVYASYLELTYLKVNKSILVQPKKLPVVLHHKTVMANGEVGWAPARMNLFTVAPQDNYFQPWNQHLVLHESRHNVQLNKLNTGTTRVLGWVFGEQAAAAVLGVHLPLWFVEGDAVAYETGSSLAGRGRVADFLMPLKAQVNEKGIYSYGKAMFGSYADYVPNRYVLGYQLAAEGSLRYGSNLWNQTLDYVARNPWQPRPFSASMKKLTGLPERKFYKNSLQELKNRNESKSLNANNALPGYRAISKPTKSEYVNYHHPLAIEGGVIAYKTSLSNIGAFVLIDSLGNEKTIYKPGYVFDNVFSGNDSLLVWNEYRATRFEQQNYSNITIYNWKKGKLYYLQSKGRSFYSTINSQVSKLVSSEIDESLQWSLTVRDLFSGELLVKVHFDTLQPVQPAWDESGKRIAFIAISSAGKSLGILNIETGNTNWLLTNELLEINQPFFVPGGLVLKGTFNNRSNFFYYDLKNQTWSLLTRVPYGVGSASYTNGELIYSEYTADGFKISAQKLLPLFEAKPQAYNDALVVHLSKQEQLVNFRTNNFGEFPVTKYRRIAHLVNFHSWAPIAIRTESNEVGIGATLMSQNVLSSSFLSAGYQYYRAEAFNEFFVNYTYKGFYPIIENEYRWIDFAFNYTDQDLLVHPVSGHQHYFNHNWSFPFLFDRGKWYRRLNLGLGYNYNGVYYNPSTTLVLNNKSQHKARLSAFIYQLQRTSHRDLAPQWGQVFNMQAEKSLNAKIPAYQWTVWGQLYFPGLLKNNSLQFYGGFQQKETGLFNLQNRLAYPRGYALYDFETLQTYRMDYHLPLWYPDLNVLEMLYIKRLTLNLFHDLASFNYQGTKRYQESIGATLGFDFHAFRFVAPLHFSITYAHKHTLNEPYLGINFTVDFNALY
ncbi:MAG: hypothetical protein CVU09_01180 [Bacteroidetes bacterium HGW-Bacteroidetes-4]|jgi:hypothetical protein|nr:MAG: hypothetical protein CVU09_01180 [Bacteroidetes bacterium HGW-Bacteroidetes-4]